MEKRGQLFRVRGRNNKKISGWTAVQALFLILFILTSQAIAVQSIQIAATIVVTALDEGVNGTFDFFTGGRGVFGMGRFHSTINPSSGRNEEERGITGFSLGAIPPASTIVSAALHLSITSFGVGVHNPVIEIHGFPGDGTARLQDATINNLLHTTPAIVTTGPISIDVTSFVQQLFSSRAAYVGFNGRTIIDASAASVLHPLLILEVAIAHEDDGIPNAEETAPQHQP